MEPLPTRLHCHLVGSDLAVEDLEARRKVDHVADLDAATQHGPQAQLDVLGHGVVELLASRLDVPCRRRRAADKTIGPAGPAGPAQRADGFGGLALGAGDAGGLSPGGAGIGLSQRGDGGGG